MQQEAVDVASQAMEKYNIEKVSSSRGGGERGWRGRGCRGGHAAREGAKGLLSSPSQQYGRLAEGCLRREPEREDWTGSWEAVERDPSDITSHSHATPES